jgi:hypothetical protein
MPTTAELAELLHERSGHDRPGPDLPDLHRRIARRRAARFTAGAVAVVALVAVAVVTPIALSRHTQDDQRIGGPPTRSADDRTPAEYTGGYRLADTRVAVLPAENTFAYTFTPTSYDFELMLWCDSAGDNRLRAFINEMQVLTDYCEPDGRRQEIMPTVHADPMSAKQARWSAFGVRPDQPVTVTVRVHSGLDDDPRPATAVGTAKLLLYLPVPVTDYPFPPRPPTLRGFGPVEQDLTAPVINVIDATQCPRLDCYMPLSVVKKPGRAIEMTIEAHGPGVVHVEANHVEVRTVEFWDWNGFSLTITVDPDTVAPDVRPGDQYTVAVRTGYFTAPVWRLVVRDAPPQRPGG